MADRRDLRCRVEAEALTPASGDAGELVIARTWLGPILLRETPCSPAVLAQQIAQAAAIGGLIDSRIAELLAANNREVERRRAAEAATRDAAAVAAAAIAFIVGDLYTPDEATAWLAAPHPMLGGGNPAAYINSGRGGEVLQILAQLIEGAYP